MEHIVPAKLKVDEIKSELGKRNLATTGKKGELVDRLVADILKGHTETKEKLKEILKNYSLPLSGTKEEMLKRITDHLKGSGSEDVPFELTETFNPNSLPPADLKAVVKRLGLSAQGRKSDVLERVITAVLDHAATGQLEANLKAHHLPHSGSKDELKNALRKHWLPVQDVNIDINNATVEKLLGLAGGNEEVAKAIVANRPFCDAVDLKKRVNALTATQIKDNLHLLTGWVPKPQKEVKAKTSTSTPKKKKAVVNVSPTTIDNTNLDLSKNEEAAKERLKNKQVKIASWNIRNISKNKDDAKLDKILAILTSFDFVAVQEVRDQEIMDRIQQKLGSGWSFACSGQVGTAHHKEHYGIIYRNTHVSILTKPEVLVDTRDDFVREPFIGYYKAGEFDFILATIHVVWGDSIVGRREEIKKLEHVLHAIQQRAKAEKDIIIVGDFNMPPVDLSWGLDGWKPLMNPPQKTVVGDTSLYDNIWISEKDTYSSEYTGFCGCIEFDKLQYEDSITGRRKAISEISDHRPIWGLFSTAKDDDARVEVQLANLSVI